MVFRRRDKLSWWQFAIEGFWPKAGWPRVIAYFRHRIRRLPDTPHKVARGMFAGTVISMLPLPGLQMVLGGLFAWSINGNILAAVLCSFISNPVTFPFITLGAIKIGQWMVGETAWLTPKMIANAMTEAIGDLWHNVTTIFTDEPASWVGLGKFWHTIFVPYFLGSLVIGLVCGAIAYYVSLKLVQTYQRARTKRFLERAALRQAENRAAAAGQPEKE